MNHPHIVLHGNNFDSNRGCQALRLSTQLILDRYLPDYPRLYANIFATTIPNSPLTSRTLNRRDKYGKHAVRARRPFISGARESFVPAFWPVSAMKAHRALDNAAALLALGGDNCLTITVFWPRSCFSARFMPRSARAYRQSYGVHPSSLFKRPNWNADSPICCAVLI